MGNNMYDVNDQTHLDGSHRSAGEAVQISREIEGSLLYQQSRLEVQFIPRRIFELDWEILWVN
jgi:hypothetical protein